MNIPILLLEMSLVLVSVTPAQAQSTRQRGAVDTSAFWRRMLTNETAAASFSGLGSKLAQSTSLNPPAWFTNGVAIGGILTNTGTADAWVMTNEATIRIRFPLPYDWDGGAIKFELRSMCTGTNASSATNVVWTVKGAALTNGADETSITFGTAVSVTNHVSTAAYKGRSAITGPLTVSNASSSNRVCLFELTRPITTGDTLTNADLLLTDIAVHYLENFSGTNTPTSSP